jgi:hypothetical protein
MHAVIERNDGVPGGAIAIPGHSAGELGHGQEAIARSEKRLDLSPEAVRAHAEQVRILGERAPPDPVVRNDNRTLMEELHSRRPKSGG